LSSTWGTSIAAEREQAQLAAQTAQYQADAKDRQGGAFAQPTNHHTTRNLAYFYTVALCCTIAAG
jgi:hypothetical protein